MKLYTYFQSSAAYRVRIALNLKGIKAEMAFIDLTKGEQKNDDYAKLNPQKIVPALIDGDQVFTQSLSIMEYLDEREPEPPLLPNNLSGRAYVRAVAYAFAQDISPLGNLKVRKYLQSELKQTEEKTVEWINHWIADGLEGIEKLLERSPLKGKFCYGDEPTMADCCLVPQIFNAKRWKTNLLLFPNVIRIYEECEKHPAFIAAHPLNQQDAPK